MKRILAFAAAAALAFGLTACSSDSGSGGGGGGTDYVTVNGSEPQNPLVPGNTNETGGGSLLDVLFAGLSYYDTEGKIHNELAESIEKEGDTTYRVTLQEGKKFTDGTTVKAENFCQGLELHGGEFLADGVVLRAYQGL